MSNWRKVDFSTVNSKVPQSTLEVKFEDYQSTSLKHRLIGSKYKALRHSEQINKIDKFISENRKNGFSLDNLKVPSKEKDIFYNQLKILISKLKIFSYFQEKYKLRSKYDLGEILLGTLRDGFKFNSLHKKRIEEDTRSYLRGQTNFVYQDFPASHLLPWLDEEPIEKIYVFDEPIPINQRKLDRVISVMDESILDDALIRDIDLIDALYLINNKKMNHLDSKGRTKTAFDCRGDEMDISFPHCELDYLFKKVTTDPATSRMAGLPTVKTRNVGYIAHHSLDAVTCNRRDLYKEGLEPTQWIEKLSSTSWEGEKNFIMIDFKKSGLTTNRNVIRAVYETALKHYPQFRPFVCYLDCLTNIYVNGSLSKRGTSLGMDDNAISFFLSCAFEAWLRSNSQYERIVEAYFKGDDQIIICNCDMETTKLIFRSWIKDLKKLGFLVNAKKSFIGLRGQFCEIVGMGQGLDSKIIEYSLNCLDALGTYNMVDFKIYLNNLKKTFDSTRYSGIFNYCLVTTILSVEQEFDSKDEYAAPFEMGGYFSNYERRMNTFIVDVIEEKFKLDRRLYNVIGVDLPTQSFEYKRRRRVFESIFDDTSNLLEKIRRISAEPMSRRWRESYDLCLKNRQDAFNGKIELIGSKLQKLLDEKDNFVLPESMLIYNPRREKQFVPKRKFKGKLRKEMEKRQIPKIMVKKISKNYYLIDEIRAKELLKSGDDGNNVFLINYYYRVPASTLIWSLAKFAARSNWAIPMNWAEYCYKTKTSLDDLWSYYSSKGLNLYDYQPRYFSGEAILSNMFRGREDADTLIFCPFSGFPIKFSSWNFFANRENRGKDKRFYLDIADKYFPEWLSEEHQLAWWGKEGRNEPFQKEKFFRVKKLDSVQEVLITGDYYAEVLQPYLEQQGYLPPVEETEPQVIPDEESLANFDDEHYSDSDMLEEYFRDNPLNTDSDQENDPYQNLSSSSEEEEE